MTKLILEDHEQDFTEFYVVEEEGFYRIVDCQPFQYGAWVGRMIQVYGKRIHFPFTSRVLKYPIKSKEMVPQREAEKIMKRYQENQGSKH